MPTPKIAILGAGLQGVCVALALRARGYCVDLIDKMPAPMMRASLCNEGKIHLGFVYGNDATLRSARAMLESALAFAPALDEWLPAPPDWSTLRSRPFSYLILTDSLLTPDQLFNHYEHIEHLFRDLRTNSSNYMGLRPERLWEPRELPLFVDPDRVVAAARTCEVAVDLNRLRRLLTEALGAFPEIRFHPNYQVREVSRTAAGFRIQGRQDDRDRVLETGCVVNCLWEGRLEIDRQLGSVPDRPWVYRLKFRVLGRLPDRLGGIPSLTMVLGPYGDVVPLGDMSYLSWYPACRQGWSTDLLPPEEWEEACRGILPPDRRESLIRAVLEGLEQIIPGIREAQPKSVDGGIIFSWGKTDVENPTSELHQRHDIGIREDDGYFSIDTGKLTCAPWHARRLLERL